VKHRLPFSIDTNVGMRTDLAIERYDLGRRISPGVRMTRKEFQGGAISRVIVEDQRGAAAMGKPPGTYITIESFNLRDGSPSMRHALSEALAAELGGLLKEHAQSVGTTLVVGLGNWNVTPDALGPRVVQDMLITRHLLEVSPEARNEGLQSVCAVAPGVLGITGIETGEIIRGIVDNVQPDLVIAIDALASRSVERVGTTIQIADTGINPGSGVGNKRKALSRETLGIPVIAIGCPTVVYAATIAQDTVEAVMSALASRSQNKGLDDLYHSLSETERRDLVCSVLSPHLGNLVVTPKEIDAIIEDMAKVIAGGLNVALHPELELEETLYYL
jgi:spore protease